MVQNPLALKSVNVVIRKSGLQVMGLPLTICVTLGKLYPLRFLFYKIGITIHKEFCEDYVLL